jgi:hypothetical protein
MADKKFLQACQTGGSIYGKRRAGDRELDEKGAVSKDDLMVVYNKFYKNQVAALYKIIRDNK